MKDISNINLLFLFICVLGNCLRQVCLKLGAISVEQNVSLLDNLNPFIFLGLFIYGSSFILWLFVLKTVPLTIAFSALAMSFIIVPLLSHTIFDEPYHLGVAVGSILICVGVALTAFPLQK